MSDTSHVVTVLGGYGIFGGRIAEALAHDQMCRVRVVGRSAKIGQNFAHRIGADFYPCSLDDRDALARAIDGSFLVIHAAGPFQGADYHVAEQCLKAGAHYLDLADARDFVCGIGRLDEERPPAPADGRLGNQLDTGHHLGTDRRAGTAVLADR